MKCDLKSLQFDCENVKRQAKMDILREFWSVRYTGTLPVLIVLATCCKKVLGCEVCFHNCMEQNKWCPLCGDPEANTIRSRCRVHLSVEVPELHGRVNRLTSDISSIM